MGRLLVVVLLLSLRLSHLLRRRPHFLRHFFLASSRYGFGGFAMSRIAVCLLIPISCAFSQSTTAPAHFDSASIKPTHTVADPYKGPGGPSISINPGSVSLLNATLLDAIMTAYGVKEYQINGPKVITSDRYDIQAKAGHAAPPDELKQMLRQLLAERCGLAAHRETRERALREMVVAKSGGAKCPEAAGNGSPVMRFVPTGLLFQNYSMSNLADYLTQHSPIPVVDRTGLTGTYDLTIRLLANDAEGIADVKKQLGAANANGILPGLIAEQLGLKLQDRKGPLDVLVIDHLEKPTEN
jgi:uncharacterized protein (TIGR03435 family)